MNQKWICNTCGAETFSKPKNKNATCSCCGQGRYQVWNLCECGKWFHPSRASQEFCSKKCGYQYRKSGGKKGKKYPHLQRARIATCVICGNKFRATKEFVGRISKYCSRECYEKRSKTINHCKWCGKEIITSKSQNKAYCSKECLRNHYAELTKGENSPGWKGGKTSAYDLMRTSKEYKDWRFAVFSRDDFTCQKCGQKKRNLEAHHIKEKCNYPELIYDINNGITLCHECHKKTDNYGRKSQMLHRRKE